MKRFLKRVPSRDEIAANKYMRPLAHILREDSIWHVNRNSVARGVALGLFCGTIVPFGQSIAAALVAVPLRANLAVAALCTFITNPFTTPLFYLGAYKTGSWILSEPAPARSAPEAGDSAGDVAASLWAWLRDPSLPSWREIVGACVEAWHWLVNASPPTLLGLVVIAVGLALVGYLATQLSWRAWVAGRWRARGRRRRFAVAAVGNSYT